MNESLKENKNGIEFAKEIVSEINKKVKKVYWTNDEIDKWFGKRSAKEIFDSGTACFMNPCLDLNLASGYLIASRNIPYTLIIEELLPTKDFNFDKSNLVLKYFNFNRLHFTLEFQDTEGKYVINHKRENEVHIFKGEYGGRKDIPVAQIIKIPGEKINPDKPIYKNLGYGSLEDLIKNQFKGYSLEENLERLKKDNSLENYEHYKKRYGEKVKIIITP